LAETFWGLLGPETLHSERRTRNLGLGASVRLLNELAVPGIGGAWFGKQLMLATLGVAVAEGARIAGANVQNVETANAIEALACWLAFDGNGWARDDRLRGNNKLQGKDVSSFKLVRQRNFYVTQPMRMATVQALPALGLVDTEGSRFNGFRYSQIGREFVEEACAGFSPYKTTVFNYLIKWVRGDVDRVDSRELRNALSPLVTLQVGARNILKERLLQGDQRRCNALEWMEALNKSSATATGWDNKPANIDKKHWHDLRAGSLFFKTRDAALAVLNELEAHIWNKGDGQRFALREPIPENVSQKIDELRSAGQSFLAVGHTCQEANKFCLECTNTAADAILQALVQRDDHVLRLIGQVVLPGPAFRGAAPVGAEGDDATDSPTAVSSIPLPDGISHRMRNLFLLNLDLNGSLDAWLTPGTGANQ